VPFQQQRQRRDCRDSNPVFALMDRFRNAGQSGVRNHRHDCDRATGIFALLSRWLAFDSTDPDLRTLGAEAPYVATSHTRLRHFAPIVIRRNGPEWAVLQCEHVFPVAFNSARRAHRRHALTSNALERGTNIGLRKVARKGRFRPTQKCVGGAGAPCPQSALPSPSFSASQRVASAGRWVLGYAFAARLSRCMEGALQQTTTRRMAGRGISSHDLSPP
jgi:hypothetical protein